METQENPAVQAVAAAERPGVMTWFYVYCWILVVMYFAVMLFSLVFFLVSPEELEMPREQAWITGFIMAVSGAVFMATGLLPLILHRRPWLWVYDLIVICIGLTSCCFWPICIPLLIFWIKPEVKAYFAQPQ